MDLYIPGVELREELGQGASSIVYRGEWEGRPCAVKVARAGERDARWFRREAAALARTPHPGLPKVLAVGVVDRVPYLVMELVVGETLGRRLRGGVLSSDETLAIALELADVLAAVHARGLVHRDVKPRNIVLADDRVRLVDFGLATFEHSPADASGTRAYAAPEQLRTPVLVDARTDLFALGCVLSECLTGVVSTESEVGDALDPHWRTIIAGLIAENPSRRYSSAAALRSDLARMQETRPPHGPGGVRRVFREPIPLIGREEELDRILSAWRRAPRPGRVGFRVIGPSGVGKSHFLRELERLVRREGGAVIAVAADATNPRPLLVVRRMLDEVLAELEGCDQDPRSALLEALGPELSVVAATVSERVASALRIAPGKGKLPEVDVLGELLAQIVTRACRVLAPVLVLVDDAHELDPLSRAVLARLPEQTRDDRLMLVEAGRVDQSRLASSLEPLFLPPLGRTASVDLVRAHLGGEFDEALATWVRRLGGTPLDLVGLLDALIDSGALTPRDGRWVFDRAGAESSNIPRGVRALVTRRLDGLSASTRRALEYAAVIGALFEPTLLAEAVGIEGADIGFAISEACRFGLIEASQDGAFRFVHDSAREALVAGQDERTREARHEAIAMLLLRRPGREPYAVAGHLLLGDRSSDPVVAIEALAAAGHFALKMFDAHSVLEFHREAEARAARSGRQLSVAALVTVAEAKLLLGDHDGSVREFEAALARTGGCVPRAELFGRIAWAHQAHQDSEGAWRSLEAGFAELGLELPGSSARALLDGVRGWFGAGRDRRDAPRARVLCALHYQNARLGLEYQRPLCLGQSTLLARRLAENGSDNETAAKAEAQVAVVAAIMRRPTASLAHLMRARQLAATCEAPNVRIYCERLGVLSALFSGGFDEAARIAREIILQDGHWMGLYDLCLDVFNLRLVESVRGRDQDALRCLGVALRRAAQAESGSPIVLLMEACADVGDAVLGRVTARAQVRRPATQLAGFVGKGIWGPQLRSFVERGDFGPGFEALVRDFDAQEISPRRAHPILAEYYIGLTQARVHQTLIATPEQREAALQELDAALRDLATVAKFPLFRCHLHAAQAWRAHFDGKNKKARRFLSEAQVLADQEMCARVRYDVERVHAHILASEGRTVAAEARAHAGLQIALKQGAVYWERWICEEFSITAPRGTRTRTRRSTASTLSTQRRQLGVLMRMLRTGAREVEPADQARLLVDELVAMVGAERAVLALEDDGSLERGIAVGRDAFQGDWDVDPLRVKALIDGARAQRATTRSQPEKGAPWVITIPLWLHEEVAGVLYLERGQGVGDLASPDLELLVALSYQIPVALELARTLKERDRLHAIFQQTQKMEAVGRFAGGIAHDFQNMMTVMLGSLDLLRREAVTPGAAIEIGAASDAAERAATLTRKLLSFTRTGRKDETANVYDLNVVLEGCALLIERLTPEHVTLELELDPAPIGALVGRNLFEQAVINLAQNAAHAMTEGGTITIRTEPIKDAAELAERHVDLKRGGVVMVSVRDTGTGMPPEVLQRIFDPFFTTKSQGEGTGLGLSMVYGFAHQFGGAIEVDSKVGEGTEFRLYLPARTTDVAAAKRSSYPPEIDISNLPSPRPDRTILLVDDTDLVRRALERMLSETGYRVLSAAGPLEALDLAKGLGADLHLVITDVNMPGMSGPELGRAIVALSPQAKLLFISGYDRSDIKDELPASESFLQKPFRPEEVRIRIDEILRDETSD